MASTSTKFALNKQKLNRKSFFTRQNEAFDKKSGSTSKENWFTPNFKNCIHQQKKAPNRGTKFVINTKSVSIRHNKEFIEKCDFNGLKCYFHLNNYVIYNK